MKDNKKAILVVSFGTSYHDTCTKNIGAIETAIAAAFPDWEVRRAFTSKMIMKKLRNRDNIEIDCVEEALERLAADGFETVVCQPTHVLNGTEYDDIVEDAAKFTGRFKTLKMGAPLLTGAEDYKSLVAVVSRMFPAEEDTAICLMGHGSEHFADSTYAALDYHFKDGGRGDIFVGTVEGFPDLNTLMRHVAAFRTKKVVLAPLMVVAGDHAINDMASDEEDSWKTAFVNAGYEVECVLKGLGESQEVRECYVAHIRAAIDEAAL